MNSYEVLLVAFWCKKSRDRQVWQNLLKIVTRTCNYVSTLAVGSPLGSRWLIFWRGKSRDRQVWPNLVKFVTRTCNSVSTLAVGSPLGSRRLLGGRL